MPTIFGTRRATSECGGRGLVLAYQLRHAARDFGARRTNRFHRAARPGSPLGATRLSCLGMSGERCPLYAPPSSVGAVQHFGVGRRGSRPSSTRTGASSTPTASSSSMSTATFHVLGCRPHWLLVSSQSALKAKPRTPPGARVSGWELGAHGAPNTSRCSCLWLRARSKRSPENLPVLVSLARS